MFWYECKKLWCRWMVFLTLGIVILSHIIFIQTNQLQFYAKEYKPYYDEYEGVMDENWRSKIIQLYDAYIQDAKHWTSVQDYEQRAKERGWTDQEIKQKEQDPQARLSDEARYHPNFIVLEFAYQAAHFHETLSSYVDQLSQELRYTFPSMDLSIYQSMFERVDKLADSAIFSCDYGYRMMQGSLSLMIRTYIILMIVVLSPLFTKDAASQTLEVIVTTKYGCRTLQSIKIAAAMFSGVLGWLILVVTSAITIGLSIGFDGEHMLIQDFLFNSSFLAVDASGYVWSLMGLSLCSTFAITSCMILCGAWVKKQNYAYLLTMAVMLIPPLWNHEEGLLEIFMYHHPANFVSFNYIVSNVHITSLFDWHVPSFVLVGCIMVLLPLITMCLIHFRNPKAFIISASSAAE